MKPTKVLLIVFITWLLFLFQQFFIGLGLPLDLVCSLVILLNLFQLPGRALALIAGGLIMDVGSGTPGFFLFGFFMVFLGIKFVFSLVSLNNYLTKILTIFGSLLINLSALFLISRLSFAFTKNDYYLSLFVPGDFSVLTYLILNSLLIFVFIPSLNKMLKSKYVEIS